MKLRTKVHNSINPNSAKRSVTMNFYLFVIRSTDHKIIFNAHADYEHCLRMIRRLENERGIHVKAYCLMPGYLKLIAGLESSGISSEIVLLDGKTDLSLWNDFARLVSKPTSLHSQCVRITHPQRLLELKKYIECEAVRVGFVNDAQQYRYCSAHN